MSLYRRAAKVDATQKAIMAALDAAGVRCWMIRLPCDLLCRYVHPSKGWVWQPLECKTIRDGEKKVYADARQKTQAAFIEANEVPVVTSPIEALRALGLAT